MTVDDLWTPAAPLPGGELLRAIAGRLGAAWDIPDLPRRVRIAYNPRLRTTLGRAVLDDARLELNTRLLGRHPDQLVATLAHELAHLVVHMRYGKVAPHGRHFRTLMRAVGLSPAATHGLPTGRLRRRRRAFRYLHRCSECGCRFVARRVRRDLYCTACGPEMTWDVFRVPDTPAGRKLLGKLMGK